MIRFWLSEIRQIALILNSKKLEKIMRLRFDEIKYFSNAERERIIKLLEQDICPDWTITCCDGACSAYKDAVALIKGEQK